MCYDVRMCLLSYFLKCEKVGRFWSKLKTTLTKFIQFLLILVVKDFFLLKIILFVPTKISLKNQLAQIFLAKGHQFQFKKFC